MGSNRIVMSQIRVRTADREAFGCHVRAHIPSREVTNFGACDTSRVWCIGNPSLAHRARIVRIAGQDARADADRNGLEGSRVGSGALDDVLVRRDFIVAGRGIDCRCAAANVIVFVLHRVRAEVIELRSERHACLHLVHVVADLGREIGDVRAVIDAVDVRHEVLRERIGIEEVDIATIGLAFADRGSAQEQIRRTARVAEDDLAVRAGQENVGVRDIQRLVVGGAEQVRDVMEVVEAELAAVLDVAHFAGDAEVQFIQRFEIVAVLLHAVDGDGRGLRLMESARNEVGRTADGDFERRSRGVCGTSDRKTDESRRRQKNLTHVIPLGLLWIGVTKDLDGTNGPTGMNLKPRACTNKDEMTFWRTHLSDVAFGQQSV